MKTLLILDLDGVLFDNSHRTHLLPTGDGKTADQWDTFNKACRDDTPIMHMWGVLRVLTDLSRDGNLNTEIVFLTGRSEVCRQETLEAIADALLICEPEADRRAVISATDDALIMRAADDHRPGHDLKREEILSLTRGHAEGQRVVLFDDDLRIIEACRDLVDRAIHVQPFAGCVALPGAGHAPRLSEGSDISLRRTRTAPFGAPYSLAQHREQVYHPPYFVLPEGYKVVPVTPTPEMTAAGQELEYFEGGYGRPCEDFWQEMINVAPSLKQVFESNVPTCSLTKAAQSVLAERRRQVEEEGFTPERDDQYREHVLRDAAACYATAIPAFGPGDPDRLWPWPKEWWKPSEDDRANLVKAGALIQAAIEQIDRQRERDGK